MTQVNFQTDDASRELAAKIAARACTLATANGRSLDYLNTLMDLVATHANGNPLRLADLLAADDFNLIHDVMGIAAHINRRTGKLEGFFLPRFSKHAAETT